MIKSVPPFPPDADEGKPEQSKKPDVAAFQKAIEGSESTDANTSKGKAQSQNKNAKSSPPPDSTAKKTPQSTPSTKKSSAQTKGENPTMSDSPKKVEGSEPGKSEKTNQPSTQPPNKEEFARLKTPQKTTESPKSAAKAPAATPPKPESANPKPLAGQPLKNASQKGETPPMHEPPKKAEGTKYGKNEKSKQPPNQPPKKEEFARLKTPQKTTKIPKSAAKSPNAKPVKPEAPAPKPSAAASPKPGTAALGTPKAPAVTTAPPKPGALAAPKPPAAAPPKPGTTAPGTPKPPAAAPPKPGMTAAVTPKSLEKPFELPANLKQAVLALKSKEKPGEETAIVHSPEEAQAKEAEKVTEKDIVEVFKKAQQDVPQARAVATEIREKYPEKAKELEKFIEKELHKLKPEPGKTKKAGINKAASPFAELTSSKPNKPPEQLQSPFTVFTPPQDIRAQAISVASPVANTLPTEMIPLFTHMVGNLIHMETQGISTTQIVLNNPEFSSSRFYGTKVTFDKFSTAPNSYNIRFTGSEEAVTIIRQNVDGLYKTFSNADVNFKVNDIRAEHEPMEFKRKPSVGKDQDGGV